jgi:hypothetical protein
MPPRRRRPPTVPRISPPPGEATSADVFRPTVTGAYPRHRSTPAGATPMGSLPDAVPIIRDADSDVPQGGIL